MSTSDGHFPHIQSVCVLDFHDIHLPVHGPMGPPQYARESPRQRGGWKQQFDVKHPPSAKLNIVNWKTTIFHGKINYQWAMFNSKLLNYQRVNHHHTTLNQHFPMGFHVGFPAFVSLESTWHISSQRRALRSERPCFAGGARLAPKLHTHTHPCIYIYM